MHSEPGLTATKLAAEVKAEAAVEAQRREQ